MIRLNIGAGPNMFPGWVNLDRVDQSSYLHAMATAGCHEGWPEWQKRLAQAAQRREVQCSVWDLRRGFTEIYATDSVDCIYLGQMIEHLNPIHEIPAFLRECLRMLKPGGAIRITTPNLDQLVAAYTFRPDELRALAAELPEGMRPTQDGLLADQLCYLMFGSAGPVCTYDNYEGHFHLFTPFTLGKRLLQAGFEKTSVAPKTDHPALFGDVVDQGMSYAFAMEAVKP